MNASAIELHSPRGDGVSVLMRTGDGLVIELSGQLGDVDPLVVGDVSLTGNRAVINNLWSYALFEKQRRRSRSEAKRDAFAKAARNHRRIAEHIGGLSYLAGSGSRRGWCSACFAKADHVQLRLGAGRVPGYLCGECGSATLTCAAPRCSNMAVRAPGPVRIPRYCAEHRHEIPSFDRASSTVPSLEQYQELLDFDKRNLAKVSKVGVITALSVGAGIATAGTMAPAVGGAVGSLVGNYSGVVATNYGLALLGGGAVGSSSMALGMAGGTMVVSAVGGALSGGLGASITLSYVGDDKSFSIEKLRDGSDTPVVVVNGFLTEGKNAWGEWRRMIEKRYPDSPVYRVHWGSRELGALATMFGVGTGKGLAVAGLRRAAAKAAKNAPKKLGPVAPLLVAADLAKNPWHTAKNRADRTGVALAGLLARIESDRFVLVGHSLGARVVLTAAEIMSTNGSAPSVESVHVLGAAIGAKGDWRQLSESVETHVYNYYSTNDSVLRVAYRAAQAGSTPAGLRGFRSPYPQIKDRDVSAVVGSHSAYFHKVSLA